jgi:RNA polymerase sigma-70 factor (ECF subfamily)
VASDKRKNKWNRSVTETVEDESFASVSTQPDEQAHVLRQTELLDRLLAEMSEEEREIFVLFEIEEMTRTEVAESLGIPEGTAASRLRRARESFERLLRRARTRTGHNHV